jgi:hypothetical protein
MADPERPIPLAIVIWFGSLEFMSLGYGYDMVLLPPRHPTDGDYELSQPGGAIRRYRRSKQARAARRRRARHNHRLHLAEGDRIPRSGTPQPSAGLDFLVEGLGRTGLTEGNMPTENPAAPPSGETPLSGASVPRGQRHLHRHSRLGYTRLPGPMLPP